MECFPSYGGAPFRELSKKVIRLILRGCTNRPFFHISVQEVYKDPLEDPVIEQIGNYDPLPNQYNEKLVAINFQRLEYWIRKGAEPTKPVQKILGLCGYFPVHSSSLRDAYLARQFIRNELEKLRIEATKICPEQSLNPNKIELETEASDTSSVKQEPLVTSLENPEPSDNSNNAVDHKN